MKKKEKSILKDYMRNAYEEFAELLYEELYRKNAKQHKMVGEVKAAMKRVMTKEFGDGHEGGGWDFS
jgi:hypothetical protein